MNQKFLLRNYFLINIEVIQERNYVRHETSPSSEQKGEKTGLERLSQSRDTCMVLILNALKEGGILVKPCYQMSLG